MITEEGIDLSDLKQMPLPKLNAYVVFYFKGDFLKDEVEKAINKKSDCSGKCKSKDIDKNNNGYIIFKFKEVDSFDGENLVKDVVDSLYNYKQNILEIKQKYSCDISIETTFYLTSFNEPYLFLDSLTIQKMAELGLSLDQAIKFFDYSSFKEILEKIK